MFSRIWRLAVPVVLAVALALLPAVSFAGVAARREAADRAEPALLAQLWHGLVAIWEREGGSIDPSGGQGAGTNGVTGSGDAGNTIDPHG